MTTAQDLAQFIGRHAIELLLVLLIVVVLAIVWLWRWIEANEPKLGARGPALWHIIASLSFGQRVRQRYPRAWSFGKMLLSPSHYLGLHLTIGLLLSLAALNIFAALADQVV